MYIHNRHRSYIKGHVYWRGFKDGMAALTVILIGMAVVFTAGYMV